MSGLQHCCRLQWIERNWATEGIHVAKIRRGHKNNERRTAELLVWLTFPVCPCTLAVLSNIGVYQLACVAVLRHLGTSGNILASFQRQRIRAATGHGCATQADDAECAWDGLHPPVSGQPWHPAWEGAELYTPQGSAATAGQHLQRHQDTLADWNRTQHLQDALQQAHVCRVRILPCSWVGSSLMHACIVTNEEMNCSRCLGLYMQ